MHSVCLLWDAAYIFIHLFLCVVLLNTIMNEDPSSMVFQSEIKVDDNSNGSTLTLK